MLNIRNFYQEINNNNNNEANKNKNISTEEEGNEIIDENTNLERTVSQNISENDNKDDHNEENNEVEATPQVNITPENGGDDTIENTNKVVEEPIAITNNEENNHEDIPIEDNNNENNEEDNNDVDNNENNNNVVSNDNNNENINSKDNEDNSKEEIKQEEIKQEKNTQQTRTTPNNGDENDKKDTIENANETTVEKKAVEETAETTENNENIPAIVVEKEGEEKENGEEEKKKEEDDNEDEEEKEDLADNLEVKNEFHDIFNKDLSESGDATELKRTLSNLYDKIRILSRENINEVQDASNTESPTSNTFRSYPPNSTYPANSSSIPASPTSPMSFNSGKFPISPTDDINKYYQSFSGTLQRFKPMAAPSAELCATINNRYQNNINIQEFFDRLEKITAQNAYAINNSLSSLANLVHASTSNIYSSSTNVNSNHSGSFNDSFHDNANGSRDDIVPKSDALKNPKKLLNQGDAGLNKNFRSYFKFAKKKIKHNTEEFVSNITTDTIPIPNIQVPTVPSIEELPQRDPLSLGLYYHNRQQYDVADYYFTLSSVDNNAIGLYLHGMYLKYGYGISGCSPELGFQYLLKSAEASIQSIPTVSKGNGRTSMIVPLEEANNMKGKNVQTTNLNDEIDDDNELVAEKMLMKTNIANMLTKLTDEEFETWIVRCIVSLPIYEIGQSFLHGHGVPKSHSKAVYCFNVAAYMGDADAQLVLARCYKHGIGVKKTRKMAAMWFRKAHANGKCIFGESWVWKKKYN